jgi:HlyD family secretion protein
MSHERILTIGGFLAALIATLLLSLWIRLPLEFTRPCRLLPSAEYLLMQTGADTFEARLIQRDQGERRSFNVYRYQRGDLVRFTLNASVRDGARVAAGDEVAYLHSHTSRAQREALALELHEAEAELLVVATGEKSEVIAQARGEANAAEALLAQRKAELERTTRLHAAGLLSDAEYESAASLLAQAQAKFSASQGKLDAAIAGEKAPIVEAQRAHVELLRGRLREAEQLMAAETLHAPFTGEVIVVPTDSALVRIASIDTLYAFAPVPPSRATHLREGNGAEIRTTGTREPLRGFVVDVDCEASEVRGRSFFWATVAVPNPGGLVRPGVLGALRFTGERVTLFAWFVDRLRHAGDRTLGV